MNKRTGRRQFLCRLGQGVAAVGFGGRAFGRAPVPGEPIPPEVLAREMPMRTLNKIGERVSMFGLGGYHAAVPKEDQEVIRLVQRAYDLGVTFFDNAWGYHEGRSERLFGKALKPFRQKVFLMTKSTERKKEGARKQLEESLRRLQTDYLDLWQFHSISKIDEVRQIFSPGGAYEVALKAKQDGKISHIGITGHFDPAIHREALKYSEQLESIQFPVNVVDPHYRSFVGAVLPEADKQGLAVLAMKTLAFGKIPEKKIVPVKQALRFVWSQPVSVLISGVDSLEVLEHNVAVAKTFTPMPVSEQKQLVESTAPFAGKENEVYKTWT